MPSVRIACVAAPCIQPADAGNAARVGFETVSQARASADALLRHPRAAWRRARSELDDPVSPACEQVVEVPNPQGIHVRPAQKIVELASQFKAQVGIRRDDQDYDAKSTLRMLQLAAEKGSKLIVYASGEDAELAVAALAELVASGFGEM